MAVHVQCMGSLRECCCLVPFCLITMVTIVGSPRKGELARIFFFNCKKKNKNFLF